jgi:hypothetical protein
MRDEIKELTCGEWRNDAPYTCRDCETPVYREYDRCPECHLASKGRGTGKEYIWVRVGEPLEPAGFYEGMESDHWK